MTMWNTIGEFFYGLSQDFLSIPRLLCLCAVIIGYFFGLFQSAYFISRARHVDIYSQGSGNPGTTNMFRVMGAGWGIITFIFDVGKVVGAIFLCRYLFLTWLQLPIDPIALTLYTGFGAVLGHDFPIYLRGKGGKGVACTCAVICMIGEWKYILVGAFVFFLIFFITRYVSLASMILIIVTMFEFLFFTLMNWTYVDPDWLLDCQIIMILFAVLTLITHRKNIVRLLWEEEPRFRFRKKKREEEYAKLNGITSSEISEEELLNEEPDPDGTVYKSILDLEKETAEEAVSDAMDEAEPAVAAALASGAAAEELSAAEENEVTDALSEEAEDTTSEAEDTEEAPEEERAEEESSEEDASEEAKAEKFEEAEAEETAEEELSGESETEESEEETAEEELNEASETEESEEAVSEEVPEEAETDESEEVSDAEPEKAETEAAEEISDAEPEKAETEAIEEEESEEETAEEETSEETLSEETDVMEESDKEAEKEPKPEEKSNAPKKNASENQSSNSSNKKKNYSDSRKKKRGSSKKKNRNTKKDGSKQQKESTAKGK